LSALYTGLARIAIRYHWLLLALWLAVVVAAAIGAAQVERVLKVGGFSIPGTEFYATSAVLARQLNISSDKALLVVFHSPTLRVTDEAFYNAVETAAANLHSQPFVSRVDTFYSSGIPDMVSADNHTTYALATLEGQEEELEEATPHLRELVRSPAVEVYLIGQPAVFFDTQKASTDDLARVERFTFPLVFILLVLVFGSLVASGVPLMLGGVCVVVSLALLAVLGRSMDISIFALNVASMIGLGLSIDFSLIMVSRFREELARLPPERALEATLQTAGRSITFSGITLMLTMAVLTLLPVMLFRSIALAIVIVAGVAVLGGLLLLPSLLIVLGPHLHRFNLRRLIPWRNPAYAGWWYRWAHSVMSYPWESIGVTLVVLGILALPALSLQRTGVGVQVLPESSESRATWELMARQFGPGETGPLFVVVQAPRAGGLWQPDVMEGVYQLHQRLESDPRVARVQSLASIVPNPSADWMKSLSQATIQTNTDRKRVAERLANLDGDNSTTVLIVYPRTSETDRETQRLLLDVRAHATEWAPGLSSTRVLVGGAPAQHNDFEVVYSEVPLLLGLSLLVTFMILMLFFHSVLLPIKAILLNLVSLLASFGVLVFVFQEGNFEALLGFQSLGALLSYTPVLLFSILFGLSTDYEVFLLTRVREYFRQGFSNEESVALGLDHTASIITAAGAIMIAVFGSFALTQVLVIKELGFGLAVAVLIDTTLVRMVLVPATMQLMGEWNWWMPRALDRLIPEIDEGESAVVQAGLSAAAAESD
jgi:putative drug exporter of the RND superfamily